VCWDALHTQVLTAPDCVLRGDKVFKVKKHPYCMCRGQTPGNWTRGNEEDESEKIRDW
jgi:hypothetical protein